METKELRETLNRHGFDDETIRLAEAGHTYWREHKWENDPHLHKAHLEATPTFWNMNGSAMDMFLLTARGVREALLAAQGAQPGMTVAGWGLPHEANWDGYGALPISAPVESTAKALWCMFQANPEPTTNGTVSFEGENGAIEIGKTRISAWFDDGDKRVFVDATLTREGDEPAAPPVQGAATPTLQIEAFARSLDEHVRAAIDPRSGSKASGTPAPQEPWPTNPPGAAPEPQQVRAALDELREAAQEVIEWENEYRTINHLGKYPPSPFVRLAIALASRAAESAGVVRASLRESSCQQSQQGDTLAPPEGEKQ